jgi:hypothetical protein
MLRRRRGLIDPATGLRLAPFQVFTQRVAQPILAGQRAVIGASSGLVGHGVLCSSGFATSTPELTASFYGLCRAGEPMMTDRYALAPLPQQTLCGWRRFVSTGKPANSRS